MSLLSIGRTTFYKLIKLPEFPAAVQLISGGDYFWLLGEVRAYLETRRAARQRTHHRRRTGRRAA